ncbi:MAG TPA: LuxR C-terminal-related transcriptional regulator [Chryseosolibacter sp.]|nr:LuxR C-terminal-related transcriptional regulator [Chryseosolibacter sp.]
MKSHYTKFGHLGAREKEVLRLLALGKTAQEIAAELFIATSTAETHRKNIRKKLEAYTNHDLVMYARAFDLI